jgi:hypothetical protein
LKQISQICRVSVPYINAARKTSPTKQITKNNLDTKPGTLKEQRVSAQKKKLIAADTNKPIVPETLVELFRRASPDELRECARVVGVAHVWDHMILPLL